MAGAGYKNWTAGDIPTADQFDTLIQEQTVMTFPTAAARDTALSLVKAEGMVCNVLDENRRYTYDGSAWQRTGWWAASGRTGCTLARVANQSIVSSTPTAISWDTEVSDSDGFITVTASTVTIPSGLGGLYSISARVVWASSPGTSATVAFVINGAPISIPGSAATLTIPLTVTMSLTPAETIQFTVSQATGSPVNATAGMWVYRIGL